MNSIAIKLKCLAAILLLILTGSVLAQDQWRWVRNDDLLNPSGINARGCNSPFLFDIDSDGDKDLIIGENGIIELYYNDGFPAVQHWRRDSTYFANLQFTNCATPAIGDFDLDGQVELVVAYKNPLSPYTDDSLHVYRNAGTPQHPQWLEIFDFFNFETYGYSYPKFIDWDNDGDFDLILFAPNEAWDPQYWFFRNQGVAGNPVWNIDSTISAAMPVEVCGNEGFEFADFNDDGMRDIIYSFMVCDGGSAIRLDLNGGTNSNPIFNYSLWLNSNSGYLKNIAVADLDSDGDIDVIEGGSNVLLLFHENIGNPQSPAFNEVGQPLGLPYHEGAECLTLLDRNNDNDYDIAMSYRYSYTPDPWYFRGVFGIENNGTSANPDYTGAGWLSYSLSDQWNYYLSSGDINGDSWIDLVAGKNNDLILLRNVPDSNFTIDRNYFASLNLLGGVTNQELVDLNSDGLLDLIVRDSATAQLIAFQNTGTLTLPAWTLNSQLIEGMNISANCVRHAHLNRDSMVDLVAIIGQGRMSGFLNIGSQSAPYFLYDSTIFADLSDQRFLYYDLADIDGDGDDDILSNFYNLLFYFENRSTLSIEDNSAIPHSIGVCRAYPNPFNGQTTISFTLAQAGQANVAIYDIAGRLVGKIADRKFPSGQNRVVWDATGRPSGVYFVRVSDSNFRSVGKLLLLK
jgi:hypothetical protein